MGSITSTRWKGYTRRRTVESCKRINAREAQHVGAATTTTQIANMKARRLWCLCECGRRVSFLYKLYDDEACAWKCRTCHQLTNRKAQEKGTRAAFEAWLTAKRWQEACEQHSATKTMYERMGELRGKIVAPYEWDKCDAERRAELLKVYANTEVVRQVFEQQRAKWSEEIEVLAQDAGAQIRADLYKMWKQRNRSSKP